MKRLLSTVAIALLCSSGLLGLEAQSVFAAAYGACGDLNAATYQSGEESNTHDAFGVSATLNPGGSSYFHPCSPNDNAGQNSAAVLIGITNYTKDTFLTMGNYRCNQTNLNGPICDGHLRVFGERQGIVNGDYTFKDFGTATGYIAQDFEIDFNHPGDDEWHFYYNGINQWTMTTSDVNPLSSDDLRAEWDVETKDSGDGLGITTDATNVGSMAARAGPNSYSNHAVGSACDKVSDQHHCVPNGTYGFYAYTTGN